MKKTNFLFVYGTLMRGFESPQAALMAEACKFISRAFFNGVLFDVGSYPGAVESPENEDRVYGEIYRVLDPTRVLPALDEYEECGHSFPEPHEYRRSIVNVFSVGGGELKAWVYLYNRDTVRLAKIPGGDYLFYGRT